MTKATYDTNTLASGTIDSHGPISFMIDAWINDEVQMITSRPLINELERTLAKPYFASRLTPKQTQSFISLVKTRPRVDPITTPIPNVATHPEDDLVLATAESGKASFVVTGNHGLQDLKHFKDIKIVSPGTFSEILQNKKAA